MDLKRAMQELNKLQNKAKKNEEEFKAKEFEKDYKGYVKVKMDGSMKITSIDINPQIVDPEDLDTLQDLVKAAVNELLVEVVEAKESVNSSIMPKGLGSFF